MAQDITTTVGSAIDAGLDFLAARQLPSGRFPLQVTAQGKAIEDEAVFATAHIVHSLGFLAQSPAREMTVRGAEYLRSEMSAHGLWRHWGREARIGKRDLYPFIPADLDDMALASSVLLRSGIPFPENRSFFALNRDRRGLFYTWLMLRPVWTGNMSYWRAVMADVTIPRYTAFFRTSEAAYDDVDGVVNANVLAYLGKRPETEASTQWLIDIINKSLEADCDKWYRHPFPLYYALSRAFAAGIDALGSVKGVIVSRLENATDGHGGAGRIGENALQTALAACTLLNFGERPIMLDRAIGSLTDAQDASGMWPSAPFYYGGPKKFNSWGSEELTTAFCLEALQRYQASARPAEFARCSGVQDRGDTNQTSGLENLP